MAFEHKPGKFTLFRNRKTKDSQPDWKGEGIDKDGQPFTMSIWIKEGGKGQFLSGSIGEKEETRKNEPTNQAKNHAEKNGFEDDDIPF